MVGYDYISLMSRVYLKEWQKAVGVSVRALEERSGVSLASIVRIEGGRQDPTVGLLEKLASAMGIDLVDLFRPPDKREIERKGDLKPETRTRKNLKSASHD